MTCTRSCTDLHVHLLAQLGMQGVWRGTGVREPGRPCGSCDQRREGQGGERAEARLLGAEEGAVSSFTHLAREGWHVEVGCFMSGV